MNNLPTAKELFDKMLSNNSMTTSTEMMIKFAKLHCEAQLHAILENVSCKNKPKLESTREELESGYVFDQILILPDKDSIINAYPLDLIK